MNICWCAKLYKNLFVRFLTIFGQIVANCGAPPFPNANRWVPEILQD